MRQASNEEIAEELNTEGIGYCVENLFDLDMIKDPKFRELWANAQKSFNEIEAYLKPFGYEG